MGYFEYNIVNVLTFLLCMGIGLFGYIYIQYIVLHFKERENIMAERLQKFFEEQDKRKE